MDNLNIRQNKEYYATQNGAVSYKIISTLDVWRLMLQTECKHRFLSDVPVSYNVFIRIHYSIYSVTRTTLSSYSHYTHAYHNSSTRTTHQYSCCIYRLKLSHASPHSPGPQTGTLTTASARDDAVGVSHRQELSTSSA